MDNRKIDQFVAEKIMGWREGHYAKGSWFPSTDIRDAWKVVDKFTSYKLSDTFAGNHKCQLFFNGKWVQPSSKYSIFSNMFNCFEIC